MLQAWESECCQDAARTPDCPTRLDDHPALALVRPTEESPQVTSLTWAGDGAYLAVGNDHGQVEVWDVETNTKLRTMAGHAVRTTYPLPPASLHLLFLATDLGAHSLGFLSCHGMVTSSVLDVGTARFTTMTSVLPSTRSASSWATPPKFVLLLALPHYL